MINCITKLNTKELEQSGIIEVGQGHLELHRWQVGAGSLSVSGFVILNKCVAYVYCYCLWCKWDWYDAFQHLRVELSLKEALSLKEEPCSTMNFTFVVTFWRYYMVMTHCSSNFCTMSLWALSICHDSISLGISDERIKIKRENKKSISNGFQIPISYKRELNIPLILQPSSHITWIKTSKLFTIKNSVKSWNIYKVK